MTDTPWYKTFFGKDYFSAAHRYTIPFPSAYEDQGHIPRPTHWYGMRSNSPHEKRAQARVAR